VQFIEHNATASLLTGPEGTASTPTPSTTLARATAADTALTAYKPAAFPLLAATIGAQLAVLESAALGYSAVAQCFRAMLLPIDAYLALAALRAASAHAATLALLALQSSVYDLRSRYAPTMVQARFFTVPETMALWQVARLVYGDASLTTLLRAANAISDPLAVAAGTVLTILPAPITAT
jgi:prophage DNA circulation protein